MAIDKLANGLASLGRNGDSMLVHMQPNEVAGLQKLAELHGTSLTVNPHTGMPEAFNLGKFLTSLLPTAVGIALSPATGGASLAPVLGETLASTAPIWGGALTGAALASAKGDNALMGALTGGLGGYGGGNIAGSLGKMGAVTAAQPGAVAAVPNEMAQSIAAPLPSPPSDLPFRTVTDQGITNFYGGASQAADVATPSGLSNIATGAKNLVGAGDMSLGDAWDAYKQAGGSLTQIGMPLGMATLSGLEPSDLGYKPAPERPEFDPTKPLNLNYDTGLRLLARGGEVQRYADGGTTQATGSISSGGLQDLYGSQDNTTSYPSLSQDGYGIGRLDKLASQGSLSKAADMFYAKGGYLDGPGDGLSDSIPATIEGRQPARLADGEFVVSADVVSALGGGSSKAGAKRLYEMMDRVRKSAHGTEKQIKKVSPHKVLPA